MNGSHPLWANIGSRVLVNLNDVTDIIVLPAPYGDTMRIYGATLPHGHQDVSFLSNERALTALRELADLLHQRMSLVVAYDRDAIPVVSED